LGIYTELLVRRYLSTRIIPLIAVAAVALCVALVVIVVSVMSGFLENLRSSGRTLMGDVVVSYPVQGIPYYQELIARIEKLPGAAAASPLVDTYGLVRMPYPEGPNKDVVTAQVWAIEPESFARVTELDRTIWWKPAASAAEAQLLGDDDPRRTISGQFLKNARALKDLDTGKPGALLGMHVSVVNQRQRDGSYLPRNQHWWMPNHEITVTLVPISEKGTVSQSNSRSFKVVNEVMSGVFQVDRNRVFIPLKDGQELLRLDAAPIVDTEAEPDASGNYPVIGRSPPRATQILVRAKDGVTPEALREQVAAAYEQFWLEKAADRTVRTRPPSADYVSVMTWEQRLHEMIAPVEKERQMMRILFSITYLVCAGLILAIFWSIVSEKTRDIGILRAIGASRAGVLWIFLRYGLVIGIAGAITGTLLAWVVIRNINAIHMALGNDAPAWLYVTFFLLAAGALGLTARAVVRSQALGTLLWLVATLGLAGIGVGLVLHRGFLIWDPAVYYFATIPNQMDWENAGITCIGAIVFSVLGAAVPAARGADIDPVRALRYE
jgi:lipoprotein-releasing system permease protein